jgi:hypothetical protein
MAATRPSALSLFSLIVSTALACGRLKPPSMASNNGPFDAGPDTTVDAPATDAPGDAPDAGPTCFAPPSSPAPSPASAAFGTISGPGVSADICSGDTFAYFEPAQGSPTGSLTVINSEFDPGGVQFTMPSDAVAGGLSSFFGNFPNPGVSSSAKGDCGTVAFCATLPTPATVVCDAGAGSCAPHDCYVATSASNCLMPTTPRGSWTLTLTSIGPFVPIDGGTFGEGRSEVHGTLTATLESDPPDTTKGPATLRVSF